MSKDRGTIRGFYFEIDGGDETLQEGLRNFGSALGRALTGPPRAAKPALPSPQKNGDENDDNDVEDVEEEPDLFDAASNGAPPAKKKGSGNRKPAPMPEVVDVDLTGKNGVSFQDFAAKKNPGSISDKFLVVFAWFKDHGGVDEITADHVFTCFKVAGWTPHPANYNSVLSDLKRKQKSLDKGAATGAYKINIHGINLVAKMGSEG